MAAPRSLYGRWKKKKNHCAEFNPSKYRGTSIIMIFKFYELDLNLFESVLQSTDE